MVKLKFEIEISANRKKVWNVLWNDETYRKWTSCFTEGSHAVSDWNEGSKILFLDGKGSGMYSIIDKKINEEVMFFKHMGVVMDNEEQPQEYGTESWSGAMEKYFLKDKGNKTHLLVELDTTDEFADYMKTIFPKALEAIKELSES